MCLDEATVLLILSCYCRVVDVHISAFEKIQACLQSRTKWALDENSSVELPRLQIGSYRSPGVNADAKSTTAVDKTYFMPFSTAAMHMMMIAMVSEALHAQPREVMLPGLGLDPTSGTVIATCEDDKDMSSQPEKQPDAAATESTQGELAHAVKHTVSRRTELMAKWLNETKRMLQQNVFAPC